MRASRILSTSSTLLVAISGVYAYALPAVQPLAARQSITALSAQAISGFTPFAQFAAAAYCHADLSWNCGEHCAANPDFIPIASGGDGNDVQFWYVGYSPSLGTVVVAHEGTDPTQFESVLTDIDFPQDPLDTNLFPGIGSNILVHGGFADAQAETAADVLAAVKSAISKSGVSLVTVVGHSLGGAIAILDSIFLPLHITGATFKTITFGAPRVGNAAFANYVDAHTDLTRVNNKEDLVPILPGRGLGFAHPDGEVRIQDDEQWLVCPGHDNTDGRCTTGAVKNIFVGNVLDHLGPYNGVDLSTLSC